MVDTREGDERVGPKYKQADIDELYSGVVRVECPILFSEGAHSIIVCFLAPVPTSLHVENASAGAVLFYTQQACTALAVNSRTYLRMKRRKHRSYSNFAMHGAGGI